MAKMVSFGHLDLLGFYCCVTNYYTLSGLKQQGSSLSVTHLLACLTVDVGPQTVEHVEQIHSFA